VFLFTSFSTGYRRTHLLPEHLSIQEVILSMRTGNIPFSSGYRE
jgi:hypothetical protein